MTSQDGTCPQIMPAFSRAQDAHGNTSALQSTSAQSATARSAKDISSYIIAALIATLDPPPSNIGLEGGREEVGNEDGEGARAGGCRTNFAVVTEEGVLGDGCGRAESVRVATECVRVSSLRALSRVRFRL